ncbi:MAG: hypothetical protein ACE5F1_16325 [Planctomycetota bacterium]
MKIYFASVLALYLSTLGVATMIVGGAAEPIAIEGDVLHDAGSSSQVRAGASKTASGTPVTTTTTARKLVADLAEQTWWQMYGWSEVASPPLPEHYRRIAEDSGSIPEARTSRIADEPGQRWLVVEEQGRPRRLVKLSNPSLEFEDNTGRACEFDLILRDHVGRGRLRGLLVDLTGRPYGTIGDGSFMLSVPFEGFALVRGFVPCRVKLDGSLPSFELSLHRACLVSGRIAGDFDGNDLLIKAGFGIRDRYGLATVDLDGRFEIGPLHPGKTHLVFSSRRGSFPEKFVPVELREGRQHLGTIRIEPYRRLGLRLVGDPSVLDRKAYVVLHFSEHESRYAQGISYPVRTLALDRSGRGVLDRVRAGSLDGWLWTASGGFGTFKGVRPGSGKGDDAVVRLSRSASLRVSVGIVDGRVPPRSKLVVYDGSYGLPVLELLRRWRFCPEARVRTRAVEQARLLRFDKLWPVSYDIALVSSDGVVLDSSSLRLHPGQEAWVQLAARGDLGSVRLRNASEQRTRFALIGRDSRTILRGALEARQEKLLEMLPAGAYTLVELDSDPSIAKPLRRRPLLIKPGKTPEQVLPLGRGVDNR